MKQVTALTSTYSSDVFGICSALYELGGMVVMHDASGCNSTYTTHDEPRWYERDSMIYVSAISEREAILGNDDKLISDLIETAAKLHPKFIAIVLAPIPYMIGTDVEAIARIVEVRTGIPCFGFSANGMHDYTRGVSQALETIVRAYARKPEEREDYAAPSGTGRLRDLSLLASSGTREAYAAPFGTAGEPGEEAKGEKNSSNTEQIAENPVQRSEAKSPVENSRAEPHHPFQINLLGVTPLDFPLPGSVKAMQQWGNDCGMKTGASLSVNCTLEDIAQMADAQGNLVVSAGGLAAAKWLRERFGTPYVVGVPFGASFSAFLADLVRDAAMDGQNRVAYRSKEPASCRRIKKEENAFLFEETSAKAQAKRASDVVLIGEAVTSASLAAAMETEYGVSARVLCPLETAPELFRPCDLFTPEEDDLIREIKKADIVIADPLYRPLCTGKTFYPLPHPAFSGRMYEREMPNLIARKIGETDSSGW